MKLISILLTLLMLVGCNKKDRITVAEIWIEASMKDNFLFEVYDDKTIKVIKGNVSLHTDTHEIFYRDENVKIRTYNIRKKDYSQINEFIEKIGNNSEDYVNAGCDSTEIFAIINQKLYWTDFHKPTNKNLSELTNLLLELTKNNINEKKE